jgi:hypothetical protein
MKKPLIIKDVYPACILNRNYPENLKQEDVDYFKKEIEKEIPASFLLYFHSAFVTDQGIIVKKRGIFKDYIINYADFKKYYWRYYFRMFFKLKRDNLNKKNKYLLLFDNYSGPDGYAHWILDTLPRIFAIKDILSQYVVILPNYSKMGFRRDSLDLFPIREKIYIEKDHYVKVENLYFPSFIAPTGNYHIGNITSLRKWIWNELSGNLNYKIGEKIYISRKKTGRRIIINETEIENLLIQKGFKTVYLEEYTFYEQISILYNTRFLISIHGAGLTNIIFMQPGSSLLELRLKGDFNNNMFFSLANAMDIRYFYLLCGGEFISEQANNFNININPIDFQKTLHEFINKI